ncbi:hypothetical protein ES708_10710 [subsurface metagenome]
MTTSLELQHFAVLSLSYSHTSTSAVITCTTNNPCHLTCYFTDKEPVRHATSRVLRGLALPWGAYFCFVAWQTMEQIEPGDTLSHSFEIPDWSYCQTKWFCFRGTVAGAPSPSASALLKHHHTGAERMLFEHYNTGANTYISVMYIYWRGQTFTPSISHKIDTVKMLVYRYGSPGTCTVSIRATAGGLPTGADLCSGTFDADTLTTNPDGEWVEVDLGKGTALTASTKYAIVARCPDGDVRFNMMRWRCKSPDGDYAEGAAFSGVYESWSLEPNNADFMFEEWGIPI